MKAPNSLTPPSTEDGLDQTPSGSAPVVSRKWRAVAFALCIVFSALVWLAVVALI